MKHNTLKDKIDLIKSLIKKSKWRYYAKYFLGVVCVLGAVAIVPVGLLMGLSLVPAICLSAGLVVVSAVPFI